MSKGFSRRRLLTGFLAALFAPWSKLSASATPPPASPRVLPGCSCLSLQRPTNARIATGPQRTGVSVATETHADAPASPKATRKPTTALDRSDIRLISSSLGELGFERAGALEAGPIRAPPFPCVNRKLSYPGPVWSDCAAYGQRGAATLRPHGWSSKAKGIRCLRCAACGKNFSARQGTPLFRTCLPQEKALAIAKHLAEGTGMRATARLCGVALNTVLRFAHRAGSHAQEFHDQMVRHMEPKQVQGDEAWAFVGKKRQKL